MSDYERAVQLLTEIRDLAQQTKEADTITSKVDEVLRILPRDRNFVGNNEGKVVQLSDVRGNISV